MFEHARIDITFTAKEAIGLLLGTAVGDAKGIPYESKTYEQMQVYLTALLASPSPMLIALFSQDLKELDVEQLVYGYASLTLLNLHDSHAFVHCRFVRILSLHLCV